MVFVNNDLGSTIAAFSRYKKGQIVVVLHDFNHAIKRGMMGEVIKATHKRFSPNVSRMSFNFSTPKADENQVLVRFKLKKEEQAVPHQGFRRASDTLNITSFDGLKKIRLADKKERFIYSMNGAYALIENSEDDDE